MKSRYIVQIGLAVALLVPSVVAQGRGASGMQGGGRQGQGRPPFATGSQSGTRLGSHGTQEQRKRYRNCEQAMHHFRKHIRAMARLAGANSINLQQARELQQQLVSDLQSMQQEQTSFTESLSDEQKTAHQSRLLEIAQSQEDLESFSEALGFELEQVSVESSEVQKQVRKVEKTAHTLEKQQQSLAGDLGID